jgi:regulator of sigma E protease
VQGTNFLTPALEWVRASVVPTVVLLGIVIFVHEFGHFLAAKWRGVRVLRFSMGFGPPIVRLRWHDTEYRLSWFPLGGYVQMAGDSPEEDGTMPDRRDEFLSHPWPGRMLIALAGPFANLVTAFVVMVIVCVTGVSTHDATGVLGPVSESGPAWQLGLRQGDRVVAVGGRSVRTFSEIEDRFNAVPPEQPLTLRYERAGHRATVSVPPVKRVEVFRELGPEPVVGSVQTGMPAYQAGIKEGDRILAVNGHPIHVWGELPAELRGQVDKPVQIRVRRAGQDFDLVVRPIDAEGRKDGVNGRIGIEAPYDVVHIVRFPLPEAITRGATATVGIVASVYGGMWMTLMRPLYSAKYLGGPLFIAQAASEQARHGPDAFLQFLALINIAIMAFNLLPIPMLDGGHLLLALVQAVRGHAISARNYLRFQRVGLALIGALFVFIIYNDPRRIIMRHQALDRAPQVKTVAPSPP